MSVEIELCDCELCNLGFDIEVMRMMGDIWVCPTCCDEWDAVFKACDHNWSAGHHDGEAGQFCDKCSGFVENSDFAAQFPEAASKLLLQERQSHE